MALSDGIQFFAATDVGRKRTHNEDNFLVDHDLGLYIVCDGMGGHAAGEVASALAVQTIHEEMCKHAQALADKVKRGPESELTVKHVLGIMDYAVQRASAKIHAEAAKDKKKRGMGTTCCGLLVLDSYGYIAHVGDSRIYLLRNGDIHQVTVDHTVGNELIRLGMVAADQVHKVPRSNAITRAVGVYEHVEVDTMTLEILPNDQFLLASDGLTGYFEDGRNLIPLLMDTDGERAVQSLIDAANAQGGKDNITAVVVRVGSGDAIDDSRAKRHALKREVLAKMPLFSRLDERELMHIMQLLSLEEYAAGEAIMQEGELGDCLYIVLTGLLQVSRGQAVLGELGPGEQLGEMALIRSMPRSATITALEPSEVIALKRAEFFEIIRTEPDVAVKLLWQFVGVLADRLEQTSRDLSIAREELSADITADLFADEVELIVEDDEDYNDPFAQRPTLVLGELGLGFAADEVAEQPVDGATGQADEDEPSTQRRAPTLPGVGISTNAQSGSEDFDHAVTSKQKQKKHTQTLESAKLADAEFDSKATLPMAGRSAGGATTKGAKTVVMQQVQPPGESARSAPLAVVAVAEAAPLDPAKALPDRSSQVVSGGFVPTKMTMPIDPPEQLRSELEVLRREFQERLKKSRKERGNDDSD